MPLDHPAGFLPDNRISELECDDVPDETARELLRLAEMRQEAIFRAALGMDQRAAILAAGFVAAAGATVAAALTVPDPGLKVAAAAGAVALAVAAWLSAAAARPQKFRFPGVQPTDWAADPAFLAHPLKHLRLSALATLEDHIRANEAQQARNGRLLQSGLRVAVAAPLTAALVWLAAAWFG